MWEVILRDIWEVRVGHGKCDFRGSCGRVTVGDVAGATLEAVVGELLLETLLELL